MDVKRLRRFRSGSRNRKKSTAGSEQLRAKDGARGGPVFFAASQSDNGTLASLDVGHQATNEQEGRGGVGGTRPDPKSALGRAKREWHVRKECAIADN